jgi:alkanesulfonate monooxygenase SsuD/methylene tetrahydromethanopterin reductase-like flavin-dependent oxidoreductase (luciferase family)
MFAASGHPLGEGNTVPDALIDALVVSGDTGEIVDGLRARLDSGLDELLVDVVPRPDLRAAQDAVFAAVRAL